MRNIPLKNKEVLSFLETFKEELFSIEDFPKCLDKQLMGMSIKDKKDYYTSDEYRDIIINKGHLHEGYPEKSHMYTNITSAKFDDRSGGVFEPGLLKFNSQAMEASGKLNTNLMQYLSVSINALTGLYPPGGFIGWHDNHNAPGWNILFTWSENGDGEFLQYDLDKKETIKYPDVPGWQCKMGYYGSWEEQDKLMYHAAGTNCWRITVAYIFSDDDMFWKEVVEDLQHEE